MFRFLTLALLASSALPVAANAQRGDGERARTGMERREAAMQQRAERAPRAERPSFAERAPRADRVERQQRSFAAPTVQAQPQAAQATRERRSWGGTRSDNGSWRAQRQAVPAAQQPTAELPWVAPPRSQRGPELRAFERQDNTRSADTNRRRDWNRNDNNSRNWNRNDNNRRDWNDGRRYDNNRGWNGNRYSNNWNRNWRNDSRYDWQRYRNSNRYAYRLPRYYAPSGWGYGYRRFDVGTYLFAGLFAQNYWIGDPYSYRLPPVEWPYQWVRYYDDALLVDTETGEVVDVISGIFW